MNSLNIDLKGKVIRLLEKYKEIDTSETFLVEDGFGASQSTVGTALFIKGTKSGIIYRINSMDRMKAVK